MPDTTEDPMTMDEQAVGARSAEDRSGGPSFAHPHDREWERWGAKDPYFSVLTDARYRSGRMTAAHLDDFFRSGRHHVDTVMRSCRRHFGAHFSPRSVFDFGCGVGRVLIPFARQIDRVVGLDVSPSMIAEARRNCDEAGLDNIVLIQSDGTLSAVHGAFDLVHSVIVLQHIEAERGLALIERLATMTGPGGVLVLHVTFGKTHVPHRYGLALPPQPAAAPPRRHPLRELLAPVARPVKRWLRGRPPAAAPAAHPPECASDDPEMHMHSYNLSQVFYLLQRAGLREVCAEFTDHGGELGVMLYTRRPPAAPVA